MSDQSAGPGTTNNLKQRVLPVAIVVLGVVVGIILHRNFGHISKLDQLNTAERIASWPTDPFTPELWRAAENHERHRLYHGLIDQHDAMIGLTVGDALTMLGPPSVRIEEPAGGMDRLEYVLTGPVADGRSLALALYIDDTTDTVVRARVKQVRLRPATPQDPPSG